MKYIYKYFLLICLLIFCNTGFGFSDGSTSSVDGDTDESIRTLIANIRIATNQQDIPLLLSYFTDDFTMVTQHCGKPAKVFDKDGVVDMLNKGYGALSEYVKQTKVISIQEEKNGYLARSSTIEVSTIKANNRVITTKANENVYIVESNGLLKANKIDSIAVCR
jgi:hypothetical protein